MARHLEVVRLATVLLVLVGVFILALRAPESGYRLRIGELVYEPARAQFEAGTIK